MLAQVNSLNAVAGPTGGVGAISLFYTDQVILQRSSSVPDRQVLSIALFINGGRPSPGIVP